MKTLFKSLTVAALVAAPIYAQAGGLAPAIEETPVVIAEAVPPASSSASNLIVPLIFLGLVGLAAASGSAGDSDGGGGAKDLITAQ